MKANQVLQYPSPDIANGKVVVIFKDTTNIGSITFQSDSRRNLTNRQLHPVCDELKIPRIGWHSLRHSNATLLDAVGTPLGTVQSLFGHSSPEITRGIYLHSLPAGAKEAVQKVEDLLTGHKRTQVEEIRNLGSTLIQ